MTWLNYIVNQFLLQLIEPDFVWTRHRGIFWMLISKTINLVIYIFGNMTVRFYRGLKLWISGDFSSRVTHHDCKKHKNPKILRYGKHEVLRIIKSLKGGHRNLLKQQNAFFAVAWTCAPYPWCQILTALVDLTLYMSNNFPPWLYWRKLSIFPK